MCCEDSATEGLYDRCQSDDLDFHSRSQMRLKLDYILTCTHYLGHYLSYYIQAWHDLELDLDFENVGNACPSWVV